MKELYIICVALSLSLHVFNMGGENLIKPFHIAAVGACIITLLTLRNDRLLKNLCFFIFCIFISTLLSHAENVFSGFINVFIVTFCCVGAAFVDINKVLKYLMIFIPFDLVALLYEATTNPIYRFQGFYDDPNYLCTTLLVFLFLLLISYSIYTKSLIRILIVSEIVVIVFLIFLTISRTGIACCIMLLSILTYALLKKHFIKVIVVTVVSFFIAIHFTSDFWENEYSLLYERVFETNDNVENARNHRFDLSLQNLHYIVDHPQHLFFGLGPSTTDGAVARQIPGMQVYRVSDARDHNSWTSCLSEYGLFALFFFSLLFIDSFRKIIKQKKNTQKYLRLGMIVTLLIFSLSIWQMTYLPFWWGLFFLNNKQMERI